jgi:pSer/pThr/pTyr-binding forkhead associated (FHA) protein
VIEQRRTTVGRGPGVDLAFDNASMSRQHAVIEFAEHGFRVSDLGSTNGLKVNGTQVESADLEHGDRFMLGDQTFQILIEERDPTPPTYVLIED